MFNRAALAGALVAATALALPAGASAIKIKRAEFMVSVEGTQTVTWSTKHTPQFECDVQIDGSGTERVKFSSKPVKVPVMKVGNNPAFFAGGSKGFPLNARVTRDGNVISVGFKACSDGDGTGGTPPEPRDCGTKRTSAVHAIVEYAPRAKDLIRLGRGSGERTDPFRNCPWGGVSWPSLLTYGTNDAGKTYDVGRRLPERDLFDESIGKHILRAGGTQVDQFGEDSATTKVAWELTLVRVGAKKR